VIGQMLATMQRNRNIINEEIATLVYYMNGGLDYNDAWMLTADQRKSMSKVIEKHFKAMNSKSGNQLM
jgi:hypothetical protein